MRKTVVVVLALFCSAAPCLAQASGNIAYSQSGGKRQAEMAERNKRVMAATDPPPTATTVFIEAAVLMNVKADEHVATFAISQECDALPECAQRIDATVASFSADLRRLGIAAADVFVDFAAQNKIYGFQTAGTVMRETLTGFELKKNVSVRYQDKSLLDRLLLAAARSSIFDLVKVDYIVRDGAKVQDRLMEEATKVINHKAARYERLLGTKVRPPAQVYAERHSTYFPTELYDSYTAFGAEEMIPSSRDALSVQRARKTRTFFFNPLDADGFDMVVDPVVIEPVVQFTLYLKVKYEIDQTPR